MRYVPWYGVKRYFKRKEEKMSGRVTIGKVAAAVGVNVETIRYYHRVGLMPEPVKEQGGFRYYDDALILNLRFIKRAQHLGFSLAEIRSLIELNRPGSCRDTHDAAVVKFALVEERIRELIEIKTTLKHLIEECEQGNSRAACPIIELLGQTSDFDEM